LPRTQIETDYVETEPPWPDVWAARSRTLKGYNLFMLSWIESFFERSQRENLSLLEVGCGWGDFLNEATVRGYHTEGIDLAERTIAFVQDYLRLKVHSGSIQGAPLERSVYDVVCSFQVLEHVYDPVEMLKAMRTRLAPGGLICIAVPNVAFAFRRRKKGVLVEDTMSHLSYFGSKTLKMALERAGIDPILVTSGITFIELLSKLTENEKLRYEVSQLAIRLTSVWGAGSSVHAFARHGTVASRR
jgi:2-polyprenyl-3-methyl-5-hydroxy-6-metoxy-1,4-benzoquinol methylase